MDHPIFSEKARKLPNRPRQDDRGHLPVAQYLEAVKQCGSCGKACALECSLCQAVYYCNAECQKKAWKAHKKQCTGYKKKEKK